MVVNILGGGIARSLWCFTGSSVTARVMSMLTFKWSGLLKGNVRELLQEGQLFQYDGALKLRAPC